MSSMWQLGGLTWKELAKRVWSEIQKDDVFGRSARDPSWPQSTASKELDEFKETVRRIIPRPYAWCCGSR